MPQKRQPTEPLALPKLTTSRADARQRLAARIPKGRDLLARSITTKDDYEQLITDATKWSKFNRDLLLQLFDNSAMADEYSHSVVHIGIGGGSLADWITDEHRDIASYIGCLDSIIERLELIPELLAASASAPARLQVATNASSRKIFVVHGHDETAKETVARLLMKLKLEPIILAEQASGGKTIIEKLETFSDVGFAVVLLTADDVGAAKSEQDNLKPRARQNVILELGYFMSRLGRERVCALCQTGVERPSDYDGVVYVALDDGGAWKFALAKEIKTAGIDVDMNLAM